MTDDQLLDLPPARIIQKYQSHLEIAKEERQFQVKLAEMQTRTLAQFMAQSQAALDAANKISFTKEKGQTGSKVRKPKENKPGSYENFMMWFGSIN